MHTPEQGLRQNDRSWAGVIKRAECIAPKLLKGKTSGTNLVNNYKIIKKRHGKPSSLDAIIDIGCSASYRTYRVGASPTLTASRCCHLGYFCTSLKRQLSVEELMRLQGADPRALDTSETSQTAMGRIVGNAMSINVISKVLEQALACTNLPAASQYKPSKGCCSM